MKLNKNKKKGSIVSLSQEEVKKIFNKEELEEFLANHKEGDFELFIFDYVKELLKMIET